MTLMTLPTRAEALMAQFLASVERGQLPPQTPLLTPWPTSLPPGMDRATFCDLLETQMMSRHLDLAARVLKAKNESFYTIGSSGHEGNAAVAAHLAVDDMAFLHYRSGAFFIQRAKKHHGSTPLYDGLLSLVASSEDPIAGGRHKVFGSHPLFVPPQTSTIASHLPKAIGAALSIPKRKRMGFTGNQYGGCLQEDGIVVCSFGDASLNHSTSQGALNTAGWYGHQGLELPLLLVCEDNGIGISVPTPQGWVAKSCRSRAGLQYFTCQGLDLLDTYVTAFEAVEWVRTHRRPALLHMTTVRLLGHAGSDIETGYHALKDIEATEAQDPLLYSAHLALTLKLLTREQILRMYQQLQERVERISQEVILRPKLTKIQEVQSSLIPLPCFHLPSLPVPEETERKKILGSEWEQMARPNTLGKLINWALMDLMLQYPHMVLFGEDVAKKGGVYNVTNGLWKTFGEEKAFNTLLDEQTILGLAIGLGHNGFLPVPEIQFLAYLHNAEDQIRGEAATLSFFSQGQFTNPMVVRIAGLAYQKGFGGHFHNDNSFAVLRDIPGIILACPSRGRDAVKMLRECLRLAHEERRVVVFLEPIALYATRDLHDKGDSGWCDLYPLYPAEKLALGTTGFYPCLDSSPERTLIITYGNGTYYSLQAQKILQEQHQTPVDVLDLRWLHPLPTQSVLSHLKGRKQVLIVDECRQTGSLSEELSALILTHFQGQGPRVNILAAADCFIPLGVAAVCGLPQAPQIVQAVLAEEKKK